MKWMLMSLGLLLVNPSLATAEEAATRTVELEGVTLTIPEAWQQQPNSSRLRLATFEIPAVEGDSEPAELAVFGNMGGSVADNLTRWIGQFENAGREATLTKGQGDGQEYYLAHITGTYNKPDGPPFLQKTKPAADYSMLAVIVQVEGKGNYFLKLTGPKKTVDAQAKKLRHAFGGDMDKEEPYEI